MSNQSQLDVVKKEFTGLVPSMQTVLPNSADAERFAKVCYMAVAENPYLLECDRKSLLKSAFTAAYLGLEPDPYMGQAYLVPFKGKVQLLIGYKGYIQLARNSGMITQLAAHVVRAKDHFEYRLGLDEKLEHIPDFSGGEITHVYALAKFKDGSHHFEVMSRGEVDKIMEQSLEGKGGKFSPWKSHYDEMAKKTAIRRLSKYLPLQVQKADSLQVAFEQGKIANLQNGDVIETEVVETLQIEAKSENTPTVDPLAVMAGEV